MLNGIIDKKEREQNLKLLKKSELIQLILKLEKDIDFLKAKQSGAIGHGATRNPHVK